MQRKLKALRRWGSLIHGKFRLPNMDPFCICDWMVQETDREYTCEPETFRRCQARRNREASESAPSTVPPLSNRGVSSSPLTRQEIDGKSID